MDKARTRLRRNLIALTGDFVFFALGLAFYDPLIVVPVFTKEITHSEFFIGILASIRILMITWPQLLAASFLMARPRKKPLLVWSSLAGRLPVLLLAVGTWRWAEQRAWIVVTVLVLSIAFFFVSEGLNSISWPDIVGKVLPARIRGRFLGSAQLAASLGSLAVGYVVRVILGPGGVPFPVNWALIFGLAFVGLMLSVVFILLIHEEPEIRPVSAVNVRRSLGSMVGSLGSDGRLRLAVGIQLLSGLAGATFPFLVVRAQDLFAATSAVAGLFLILQNLGAMIGALVCGQLIDRVGAWVVLRLVTAAQAASLVLVTLTGSLHPTLIAYQGAFLLVGFVTGSSWWSFTAYLMEIASAERRPVYLASSGILTSPAFVGSLLAGALFGSVTPELIFGAGLVASTLAASLAWRIPRHRGGADELAVGVEEGLSSV